MWEESVFIMAIHVRANSEVWLICRSRWIQIQVSYVAIMIILDHTRQVENAKFFFLCGRCYAFEIIFGRLQSENLSIAKNEFKNRFWHTWIA